MKSSLTQITGCVFPGLSPHSRLPSQGFFNLLVCGAVNPMGCTQTGLLCSGSCPRPLQRARGSYGVTQDTHEDKLCQKQVLLAVEKQGCRWKPGYLGTCSLPLSPEHGDEMKIEKGRRRGLHCSGLPCLRTRLWGKLLISQTCSGLSAERQPGKIQPIRPCTNQGSCD